MVKNLRLAVLALLVSALALSCLSSPADHPRTRHDFFLGSIWPNGTLNDPFFTTYWTQLTPENAGKWSNAEPERDRMNWEDLDRAYAFAQEHGLRFRFHTLIWGRSHPLWLLKLTPEEQIEETHEWFSLVAERYPDIDFIDVVNEPLHEEIFNSDLFGGWGETGLDWVISMFEMAREYFPEAALQTNDYGILESVSLADGYVRFVTQLNERGLIDSIGVQAHGLENASPEQVRGNLEKLVATGLPIYITELDLSFANDEEQLARMIELVTIFREAPAVRGITTWGYREGAIYSRNAYLLRADGTARPALQWLREFAPSK